MFFHRDLVRKGDLQYQKGHFKKAAELYLKAERYDQAARIYAELGETDRAVEIYDRNGLAQAAAELLSAEGRHKQAISRFEAAGAFRRAAEASLEAHQPVRAARLFERAEMYERAAETFLQAREIEDALRAWQQASDQLRAQREAGDRTGVDKQLRQLDLRRVDVLAKVGRHAEAAEILESQGFHDRAAPFLAKAGKHTEAAAAYLAAGQLTQALAAIEQVGDGADELRAEIYLNASRHREAAEIFERLGRFDAAATACEHAGEVERAAEMWVQADAPLRAAEIYAEARRDGDAARCYAIAGEHQRAGAAFAAAGEHQDAAAAYITAGLTVLAAEHYLEAGLEDAARDLLQAVEPESAEYRDACLLLIPLLVDGGRIGTAQRRLKRLRESGVRLPTIERLYLQGRIAEAAGRYRKAESSYRQVVAARQDFRDASWRLSQVRRKEETRPRAESQPAGSASGPRPAQAPRADPRISGSLALPTLPDGANLPFAIDNRVEPWWNGAQFFRALDERHDRPVLMVSFPLAEIGSRAEGFDQVMREVTALDHPAILKLEETILASDKVLLIYEPFDGRSLYGLLAERRFEPVRALDLISQLCMALSTAHKLGISHQWLSPRTVLIGDSGRPKLVGIGLRAVLAERDDISQAYLSPEVLDDGVVGPASDVYSLGLLAAELLQAELPSAWARRHAVDAAAVEWPADVVEIVPRPLRELFVRCLGRRPAERPSTSELQTALAAMGLITGQVIARRYEILGELGRGGMSRVYRARDRELSEEVAIKTVLTPAAGRSEDEDRLLREVQICRKISHPNVVRVHDFGRFPGGIFVTMELLEGPGLDEVIEREAPLPVPRVRHLLLEIAAALAEAHRLKIIHRDLKPSNVIVVSDRVKVLDFGIARMGGDGGSTHLTQTGEVIGSPMFMAPEQIQGKALTGSCDLYALGVIAYTLLAGREPFVAETTTAVVLKHLHEKPPDLRESRPELPEAWGDLIGRLLAKKPADRPANAERLVDELRELPDERA